VPEAGLRGDGLKAIVFDVDGTLYRQGPLRRAMAMRLVSAHAARPLTGWRTFRVLSAYRKAQEHLRAEAVATDLAEAQLRFACERTRAERTFVAACVERWMEREPLGLLGACVRPGLGDFLRLCRARGLRLGVLSDYPAEAKLEALGLRDLFDVVLCAQAPDIGLFKPHPRGLQVALARLGATAAESLYVGDRAEVDAAAAAAAGVPCAIIAGASSTNAAGATAGRTWTEVGAYAQLGRVLFPS
jgi:HAD superfamily hydrolase (TIGR01509 family)